MPVKDRCVEPKIGAKIKGYMADVDAPSGKKKLPFEEATMLEIHLIRCHFCRMKLDPKSRLHFETMLILSGFFINDPVLLEKRRQTVRNLFLENNLSDEFKKKGFEVSIEERNKLKALWKKDC
jgi:hypothetical protein